MQVSSQQPRLSTERQQRSRERERQFEKHSGAFCRKPVLTSASRSAIARAAALVFCPEKQFPISNYVKKDCQRPSRPTRPQSIGRRAASLINVTVVQLAGESSLSWFPYSATTGPLS